MSRVAKLISVGSVFGGVEVIGQEHNGVRGEWEYRCRCLLCGGEFVARRDHLRGERVGCRACSNRLIARNRASGKKF